MATTERVPPRRAGHAVATDASRATLRHSPRSRLGLPESGRAVKSHPMKQPQGADSGLAFDPSSREIVLEVPRRIPFYLRDVPKRARMLWDMIGHVPPDSRDVLGGGLEMARALHMDEREFSSTQEEIRHSGLERRIVTELDRRVPSSVRIVRVAEPSGEWLEILRLLYSLVRITKPQNVVETGVGPVGATTTFILEAMRVNGAGHLWSIDDNRFLPLHGINVGNGIPEALRDRHTLIVGRTRQWLEPLLRQCAPVDIFLHDGEHTFANMIYEYSTAWPLLGSAGILLTDDAGNDSIDVFSRPIHRTPLFVAYGTTHFGILPK